MSEEEIPEADPRSDLDYDDKLEIDGGTLVWRDSIASGQPFRGAYLWPVSIIALIIVLMAWVLT
mgnify:CR=1 FL=1